MKSEFKTIIATFITALFSLASASAGIFFISHIGFLVMGIILGAVVQKRNTELEKWAKNKVKKHVG